MLLSWAAAPVPLHSDAVEPAEERMWWVCFVFINILLHPVEFDYFVFYLSQLPASVVSLLFSTI